MNAHERGVKRERGCELKRESFKNLRKKVREKNRKISTHNTDKY